MEAPVLGGVEEDAGALVGDAGGPGGVSVGGVGEIEIPGGGAPGEAAGSALLLVAASAIWGGKGCCLASIR